MVYTTYNQIISNLSTKSSCSLSHPESFAWPGDAHTPRPQTWSEPDGPQSFLCPDL